MGQQKVRQVTDAKVLAAMSHPLRTRVLELLKVNGPATASMLSDKTGQAVGNLSHHLKVLADCELVAEKPELARDRRERWWAIVPTSIRWSSRDFDDDPASETIARAATSINLDRHVSRARDWHNADSAQRDSWADGPFATDSWLKMTPDELTEFSAQLLTLVRTWADRELADDSGQRRPVFFFAHAVPAQP